MNTYVGVGRLIKDIELKNVNDKSVATFTIAITRPYKNADGEYETDFINCECWGNIANTTKEYCRKGDVVGIKGSLRCDSYTDKDGNKKYRTYVSAEKITFLSSKKDDNGLPEEMEVPF